MRMSNARGCVHRAGGSALTCNPDSFASRRTCERSGAELTGMVDLPPETDMYQEGERQ